MKSKLFVLGAATLLFASCTHSELEDVYKQAVSDFTFKPLGVTVSTNPTTKALVSGSELGEGSKIGVCLVKADGSPYDGKSYNNVFYQKGVSNWTVDSENKILLSATVGKAYAYYPYSPGSSLDFASIPISSAADPADQLDYMYSSVSEGLCNSNPTASFTMDHAMAIVNYEVTRDDYTGSGNVSMITMKGNTAGSSGSMNVIARSVSASDPGAEFTNSNSMTLGSATGQFIVVPSGASSELSFKVVMDGQTYTASTAPVELVSGQVYKYTLNMKATGMAVSTVRVAPWGEVTSLGSDDANLYVDLWETAKQTDGVYAIQANGVPVPYSVASTRMDSYSGVGFVLNGAAYALANVDALSTENTDNTSFVYWQKEGAQNIDGLTDYTTVNGSDAYGLLPLSDGTYAFNEIPHLSGNWLDWASYGSTSALTDFNGQQNTEIIMAAQNNGGTDFTLAKAVKDFRTTNGAGWYVPALGELGYIFLNITELNELLAKVSGSGALIKENTGGYWSSSECDDNSVWSIAFEYGYVLTGMKNAAGSTRVRLIRKID